MLCPKFFQRLVFIIDGFIAYKRRRRNLEDLEFNAETQIRG